MIKPARSGADMGSMSHVVLKRWVRYGHDRTYVQTGDGRRLGYWDHTTGAAHPHDETSAEALAAALIAAGVTVSDEGRSSDRLPEQRGLATAIAAPAGPGTRSAHGVDDRCEGSATPPDSDCGWQDLAEHRPGAAVRARARQARADAPIRTTLARLFGVQTDERAWRLGADGEEAVAKRLAKLDHRWRVLHSVPVGSGDSDIDHVVVGPGGVFTVNAKNHPDASVWVSGETFMVNGRRVPYGVIVDTRPNARPGY